MKPLGTPMTTENFVDVLEIKRVLSTVTAVADNARFELAITFRSTGSCTACQS